MSIKGTLGRRDFIKATMAMGGGAAAIAHLPWLLSQAGNMPGYAQLYAQFLRDPLSRSVDGLAYLADAVGGGLSALRLVDTAYAGTADDTYFVNINVTCGICPKFFTIFGVPDGTGKLPNGLLKGGTAQSKVTATNAYLQASGLEQITTNARWKDSLRMTQWFSDILQNGTEDGKALAAANLPEALKKYVAPFPEGVNLQVAHGLRGGVSHVFSSLLLGQGASSPYGDINFELQRGGFVSPLQILAFGLFGDGTKDVNSGENRISGPAFSTELIGKTTGSFVTTVNQLVADSYIKSDSCEANNPVCSFDSLARSKDANDLRKSMLEKVAAIKTAIKSMGPNILATVAAKHRFDLSMGMKAPVLSSRATVPDVGPSVGFLSQVATTCELVKNLDCYRNFSLYLNLVDLDGDNFDTLKNAEAVEGVGQNYVNGTRQMGIALNMLAKLMKDTGKKIIVQICSDTGRSSQQAVDAEASTAILMAPTAVGLKDYLYVGAEAVGNDAAGAAGGGADPSDTAASSNVRPWGKNLRKADGTLDATGFTDYKHWAAGVYKLVMGKRFHNEPYVEIEKA